MGEDGNSLFYFNCCLLYGYTILSKLIRMEVVTRKKNKQK